MSEPIRLTRTELYNLVWSAPMSKVAPELGMSGGGLAGICRRNDIPRPSAGYFMKRADRRPDRSPLPEPERDDVIEIRPFHNPKPPIDDETQALIDAESDPANAIIVPDRLNKPVAAVAALRAQLSKQARPTYGRPVIGAGPRSLRVTVHKSTIPRALRILDALLKAADARGYSLRINDDTSGLLVLGQEIEFRLSENTTREERELSDDERAALESPYGWVADRYTYTPTGKLKLEFESVCGFTLRHRWSDTTRRPLEECLNEVMAALPILAAAKRERERRFREAEEQRRADARRREDQRREAERRRAQVEALLDEVAYWRRAAELREFAELARGSRGERWAQWALEVADQLDPLLHG